MKAYDSKEQRDVSMASTDLSHVSENAADIDTCRVRRGIPLSRWERDTVRVRSMKGLGYGK
jgi:hypothetical protein